MNRKINKSFYKTAWFWMIIIVLGIIGGVALTQYANEEKLSVDESVILDKDGNVVEPVEVKPSEAT